MIKIVEVFGMEVSLGLSVANLKEIQKTVTDGLKDIPAGITSTVKNGVGDAVSVSKDVGVGKADIAKEAVSGAKPAGGLTEGLAGMVGNIKQMAGAVGVIAIGMAIIGKIMEAVQPIMAVIGNIVKMIFMPLGIMLFNFLKPVLIGMIKLMPLWLDFVKDPAGAFRSIFDILRENISEKLGGLYETIKSNFDRILVPFDFNEHSIEALKTALHFECSLNTL